MKRLLHFLSLLACTAVALSCDPEKTVSVEGIDIFPAVVTLKVGETAPILVTVTPENATDKSYNLTTTDPEMSVFALSGTTVKGIAPGDGTIIATTVDGGKTAICRVVVSAKEPTDPVDPVDPAVHVASVALTPTSATLTVDETLTLEAIVEPADADDRSLTWSSSNESVATVSDGVVKAVSPGTATISAVSVDNPKAAGSCEITVNAAHIPVTGIALSDMGITIKPGEHYTITATVQPENATNPAVTWESSDPEKLLCLDDGVIIAYGVGTFTVTARSVDNPEIYNSCEVTVEPIVVDVSSIVVNTPACIEMKTGDAPFHIDVTVLPEDATDKTLIWETNNYEVATVDGDGNVTPVSPGQAIIRVSSVSNPEAYAECVVEVTPSFIPVEHIYLEYNLLMLDEDEAGLQLGITVEPSDASDPSIAWSSDNEAVARVTDGFVSPVAPGEAHITATSVSNPEVSATCYVIVNSKTISVTGVTISSPSLDLQVGDVRKVSCTVQPADATDASVIWSSSNEKVAYVDGNGEIVAMEEGNAVISVKTVDGGFTASCFVSVSQAYFKLKATVNKVDYIYQFIDMGFSSKTYWSNKNLYAEKPSATGSRFAWANRLPDRYPFTWASYLWGNGDNKKLTRYNWNSSYGTVDNQKVMLNEDNPVYFLVENAYPCDMPTDAQIQELLDNTIRVPAFIDGNSGVLFKSKKKPCAIFVPASGVVVGEYPSMEGMNGQFWSKNLSDFDPTKAKTMSFYSDTNEFAVSELDRCYGIPVRAVYLP